MGEAPRVEFKSWIREIAQGERRFGNTSVVMIRGMSDDVINLMRDHAGQSAADHGGLGLRSEQLRDSRAIHAEERKNAAVRYGRIRKAGIHADEREPRRRTHSIKRSDNDQFEGLAVFAFQRVFPDNIEGRGRE